MTTQFLPNFIANYCCGGHNSVELLLQKAIGKESSGIIKKHEQIKNPAFFKNYYESGIVCVNDLLFNLSSYDSFDYFAKKKLVKSTFFHGQAQRPNIINKWKRDLNLPDDHLREFFYYLTLLRSNLMLRLSSIKCLTIYSTQIKNY